MNFISSARPLLPALVIASMVLMPILSVVLLAFDGDGIRTASFLNPAFSRYLANTLLLVLGVAILAGLTGVSAAWVVVTYDFPGRSIIEYLLFLPLAVPAYIGAYALVDFLEFAGPVQTGLRNLFGWTSAQDYRFPEIRSLGGAMLVLAAGLYPYVYLLTRISLRAQSAASLEVARTLGAGPVQRTFQVVLPLLRPDIAAGLTIVMMETIADYGVVDYFAVQTLTTRIYTIWFQGYDIAAASQVCVAILVCITLVLFLERLMRSRSRYYQTTLRPPQKRHRRVPPIIGVSLMFLTLIPIVIGFILPCGVLLVHALNAPGLGFTASLPMAALNTLITATSAAVIAVLAALWLVNGSRHLPRRLASILLPLTSLGYAAPGIVIGIGILVPLTVIDHTLADMIAALLDIEIGLLLTGTAGAVVLAYIIRFFAIAQGATDAALGRVPPSINHVARTLGRSARGTFMTVQLPMIKGSLMTATLLIFVDCVKELPATLLLKPFNFNTLATHVYEHASLENLTAAAPAALLVTLVGSFGVVIIARSHLTDNRK
ncbi:MAG: iron ABC transporter permease [Rhodobacteraceae bacterium]|nr:iron ABC transporter permease [Paracoccaceae bacterium]